MEHAESRLSPISLFVLGLGIFSIACGIWTGGLAHQAWERHYLTVEHQIGERSVNVAIHELPHLRHLLPRPKIHMQMDQRIRSILDRFRFVPTATIAFGIFCCVVWAFRLMHGDRDSAICRLGLPPRIERVLPAVIAGVTVLGSIFLCCQPSLLKAAKHPPVSKDPLAGIDLEVEVGKTRIATLTTIASLGLLLILGSRNPVFRPGPVLLFGTGVLLVGLSFWRAGRTATEYEKSVMKADTSIRELATPRFFKRNDLQLAALVTGCLFVACGVAGLFTGFSGDAAYATASLVALSILVTASIALVLAQEEEPGWWDWFVMGTGITSLVVLTGLRLAEFSQRGTNS